MKAAATRTGQLPDRASIEVVTSAELRPLRRGASVISDLDLQPIQLQPRFQPNSDSRYHVNDLLKFHDSTFIQNAYRAILKRGPDAVGYRTFLDSLRSARLNKIDILARLRYSAEGKAKQVEVEGLFIPATIRKIYRVPFLGYLVNLAIAWARLPLLIRNQQQFEAHLLAQQEIIVEHLNHADRTLLAHVEEVAAVLQRQAETIRSLTEQAEHVRADFAHSQERQTNQLNERIAEVYERFDQADARFDQADARFADLQQQHTNLRDDFLQKQNEIRADIQAWIRDLQGLIEGRTNDLRTDFVAQLADEKQVRIQLDERAVRLAENLAELETRHKQWVLILRLKEAYLDKADANQREQIDVQRAEIEKQREQIEVATRELRTEVRRVFDKQQHVTTELVLQGERLATVLAAARERLPALDETQLRALAKEEEHALDAFYAAFDEQFRGSREDIKQRLRIYLPIITQHSIGSESMPILDVGSGRGEWLQLLKEEGLSASGVDSNRILVEWCRNRDLKVVEQDLIGHLHGLDDASLGAITGFHIIEHLPIETLVEFLNQAVRVLKPGGAVIFETPNPQNVLVGSCNFYFDPTHRNPLPSAVTKFLVESRGFNSVEVLNLNPSDDTPVEENSELARRFNRYFYGPMDYAVIGLRS
jgi:2-polyprenyl-3-methyl-5-hydroxy-6-metoxy-1,4-benzoquinol methylase